MLAGSGGLWCAGGSGAAVPAARVSPGSPRWRPGGVTAVVCAWFVSVACGCRCVWGPLSVLYGKGPLPVGGVATPPSSAGGPGRGRLAPVTVRERRGGRGRGGRSRNGKRAFSGQLVVEGVVVAVVVGDLAGAGDAGQVAGSEVATISQRIQGAVRSPAGAVGQDEGAFSAVEGGVEVFDAGVGGGSAGVATVRISVVEVPVRSPVKVFGEAVAGDGGAGVFAGVFAGVEVVQVVMSKVPVARMG